LWKTRILMLRYETLILNKMKDGKDEQVTAAVCLRSILILSPHLHIGLSSDLFPLAFAPKPYMHSSYPHPCYMPCPSHPPWPDHSNYIWWRVQVMKLLIMEFLQTLIISSLFGQTISSEPCIQMPTAYVRPSSAETKFHTQQNYRAHIICAYVLLIVLDLWKVGYIRG
jgi:hypothetical protein